MTSPVSEVDYEATVCAEDTFSDSDDEATGNIEYNISESDRQVYRSSSESTSEIECFDESDSEEVLDTSSLCLSRKGTCTL